MKNLPTRVFIYSSLAFGIIGITMIFVGGPDGNSNIHLIETLRRFLLATVCIILPSFALSVAEKYLK
ncbi:MAG: hypothetical protein M0P64_00475 [Candidatus Pacebacteria bacterium]|jgi:hypothetical protein|nr:hypothetical protein [Candidatus Paceibacterota bacterium]